MLRKIISSYYYSLFSCLKPQSFRLKPRKEIRNYRHTRTLLKNTRCLQSKEEIFSSVVTGGTSQRLTDVHSTHFEDRIVTRHPSSVTLVDGSKGNKDTEVREPNKKERTFLKRTRKTKDEDGIYNH